MKPKSPKRQLKVKWKKKKWDKKRSAFSYRSVFFLKKKKKKIILKVGHSRGFDAGKGAHLTNFTSEEARDAYEGWLRNKREVDQQLREEQKRKEAEKSELSEVGHKNLLFFFF